MNRLLRSTFTARPEDDPKLFYRNAQALNDSGLGFGEVLETAIWNFIRDFVQQHHHVPDMSTLINHFTHISETEIKDRVEAVALIPPKTRGDFLTMMEEQVTVQRTRQTVDILKEAARIVETGITIKNGAKETHLKGHISAIQYVMDKGHDIVMPSTRVRLAGEITTDGENFKNEYERVERDPLAGIGQFSGITQLDDAFRGAKRGELWTHAAFTGGLKSTFTLNWAYNQAVYYQHSSVFFSLEMPYSQVRRILYAMHSHHDKFKARRNALHIRHSLSYQRVRDGELDHFSDTELEKMPEADKARLLPDAMGVRRLNPARPEKKFLLEVIADFNNPKNEYGRIHIEVADPDKSDFTVPDLRSKAELIFSKDAGIRMIFVDHMGLMSPRNRHSSTTERLNEVIRDLKRMAMSFNRGMGIAVVGLFQISREGYKAAIKADGRYNLTHLSYANEAERSSDVVTTTFVDDDLRGRSLVRWQCLKSRDDSPFDVFYSGVLWKCRRVFTTHNVTAEDAAKVGAEIDDNMLPE